MNAHPRGDPELCRNLWRAYVGRLPRGFEPRFNALCRRFYAERLERAIWAVGNSRLRRTKERWALFLAFFGEAP